MELDPLEKELMDIESKLGGSGSAPSDVEDKLQWHLDYIESLIEQGGGGGGSSIKTLEPSSFDVKPASQEFVLELSDEDIDDLLNNAYPHILIEYQGVSFVFTLNSANKGNGAIYSDFINGMDATIMVLTFAVGPNHMLQTKLETIKL